MWDIVKYTNGEKVENLRKKEGKTYLIDRNNLIEPTFNLMFNCSMHKRIMF
jgi:hypothetical protein